MPLFEGVSDDGVLADVDATIAHLQARASPTAASASSASASAAG